MYSIAKTARYFLFSLFLYLTANVSCFSQDGFPAIIQSNVSINATNAYIVDPDSLRGNYPFGNTTMTITGPPGTRFGIFMDSFKRRSDYDTIRIHDGASTAAPVLTYYTAYSTPIPPLTVKTTSNVVTIYFHAHNDLAVPNVGWRLGLRTITNPGTNYPTFTPVFQSALTNGMMDVADYDNDGDKDILANGLIFQNYGADDSTYIFNRVLQTMGNWSSARMTSADFNADGLKDVLVVGVSNLSGTYAATTALFRNNGNNTFTRMAIPGMLNAGQGGCAVTDINQDGKPDITYTGSTNLTPGSTLFKIFLNNGGFSFTELTNNLPGLMDASLDWYDYDTDGDPDLVMNGYNTTGSITELFKNNGAGSFAAVTMPAFFKTSNGKVKWIDINTDGRMDFINTGVTTPGNVNGITPEFLLNNGGDNFTRQITNLPARGLVSLDAADYDRDGDPDIVLSGIIPVTPETDVAVYKNNGGGSYTRVAYRAGVQCLNTVKWIDLNGDNKKDLFICGRTDYSPTYVFQNMDADSFKVVSYPFTAYANGGGGSDVLVDDLNNDGLPDFMFAGVLDDQDCAEGNGSTLIYSEGWRKRPTAAFRQVLDLRTVPGLTVTANSFWRWGDVDNDGKKDVILTNGTETLRVLKNNGLASFTLLYNGKPNPAKDYDQCGVVDIDNDGVNELYAIPNKLYRWNGSSFTTLYEATGIACEGQFLTGCRGYFDFGDYNKDGLTDVTFVQGGFAFVLRNNGTGRFVNDYPSYIKALGTPDNTAREVRWLDYDNDGDVDLVTREGMYESTSWGGLRFRTQEIGDFGNIGFADFNKDGYVDATRIGRSATIESGRILYNQQGSAFFQDNTPANFIQSATSAPYTGYVVIDIDNDGDADIVYGTGIMCTFSGIYINRYNEMYRNIKVLKPDGGEVFSNGTTTPIRWTGHLLSSTVKIELTTNNGASYTTLAAAAPGNAEGGEYSWLISSAASNQCKIRITDNVTGTIIDSSDRTFTITSTTAVPGVVRSNGMKVYPNPAKGQVYFVLKDTRGGRKAELTITDISGRTVYRSTDRTDANGAITKDISSLPAGYFVVQLQVGSVLYVQKLVKLP